MLCLSDCCPFGKFNKDRWLKLNQISLCIYHILSCLQNEFIRIFPGKHRKKTSTWLYNAFDIFYLFFLHRTADCFFIVFLFDPNIQFNLNICGKVNHKINKNYISRFSIGIKNVVAIYREKVIILSSTFILGEYRTIYILFALKILQFNVMYTINSDIIRKNIYFLSCNAKTFKDIYILHWFWLTSRKIDCKC